MLRSWYIGLLGSFEVLRLTNVSMNIYSAFINSNPCVRLPKKRKVYRREYVISIVYVSFAMCAHVYTFTTEHSAFALCSLFHMFAIQKWAAKSRRLKVPPWVQFRPVYCRKPPVVLMYRLPARTSCGLTPNAAELTPSNPDPLDRVSDETTSGLTALVPTSDKVVMAGT